MRSFLATAVFCPSRLPEIWPTMIVRPATSTSRLRKPFRSVTGRLVVAITATLACLLAREPIVRADYLKIGSLTGANRDFSATVPVTYNFGVTTAGGDAGLSVINIDFIVSRRSGVTDPVVFTI
jgi:hypothetical protein